MWGDETREAADRHFRRVGHGAIWVVCVGGARAKTWMPGSSPRLSGSFFVDRVHDVDSSVF